MRCDFQGRKEGHDADNFLSYAGLNLDARGPQGLGRSPVLVLGSHTLPPLTASTHWTKVQLLVAFYHEQAING